MIILLEYIIYAHARKLIPNQHIIERYLFIIDSYILNFNTIMQNLFYFFVDILDSYIFSMWIYWVFHEYGRYI